MLFAGAYAWAAQDSILPAMAKPAPGSGQHSRYGAGGLISGARNAT
jgi:hypothetical protein